MSPRRQVAGSCSAWSHSARSLAVSCCVSPLSRGALLKPGEETVGVPGWLAVRVRSMSSSLAMIRRRRGSGRPLPGSRFSLPSFCGRSGASSPPEPPSPRSTMWLSCSWTAVFLRSRSLSRSSERCRRRDISSFCASAASRSTMAWSRSVTASASILVSSLNSCSSSSSSCRALRALASVPAAAARSASSSATRATASSASAVAR
mmetsp:Transcript_20595/g.52789  ORF Transcript_20595/g.52789 Transcript_20595/m.52789 type:complete len:205 (+) Transcript_20595:436-1050(+)